MDDEPALAEAEVVASPHDTWVHLAPVARRAEPDRRTLCGLPIAAKAPRQWYVLAGCKRCASYALRHGLDHVADLDGSEVPLTQVVDRP